MDAQQLATLDRESYFSLATFRRDGREVKTPVWFARADDRFFVFSEADAGKVKRLRNGPRARIAACDVRGRVHGEWFEAQGRRVDDVATQESAYAALSEKYGWQMRLIDALSSLSGRIHRRALLEITPSAGSGSEA